MTAVQLLADLCYLGVQVWLEDDRLRFQPAEALTEELRKVIVDHKGWLLAYVKWTRDPRPDLDDDSPLWTELLQRAYILDGDDDPVGVFGALHGMRCCGAELVETPRGLMLETGQVGVEYKQLRKEWLLPHLDKIKLLLVACSQSALASQEVAA
jgi:hypothetical protein